MQCCMFRSVLCYPAELIHNSTFGAPMKRLILTPALILTSLALLSFGSRTAIAFDHVQPPDHPSDHPVSDDADEASSLDQATELLSKVHEAYKNARAIKEEVTLTMPAFLPGEEPETMTIKTMIDSKSGKIIAEEQMNITWVNGKLYIVMEGIDDAYVEQEAKSFSVGLSDAAGGEGMPGLWTIALRENDNVDDWVSAFSLGMPGASVEGLEEQANDDGSTTNVVTLKTMMGTVSVSISDEYKVENVLMTIEQPGMPAMELTAVSNVEFTKDIPTVSFKAGNREKFASMDDLFASLEDGGGFDDDGDDAGHGSGEEKSDSGKAAPDFTLAALDGSGDITLSALKGNVVVLDFWATWCAPCKKGLPSLNEFDAWAQKEGLNVKVYAVNVWERGKTDSANQKTVESFWSANKYKTAVLMGSRAVAENYGVTAIPTTIVIGADGSIIDSHRGIIAIDTLKETVQKALAE